MTHEDFMRVAIEAARASEAEGGIAAGAVLVKGGEIVTEGKSLVWLKKDPSNHAEIASIQNAGKQLDTINLDGCVLYTTLEPCAMCVSCAAWANITKVYFGAYKTDVPDNPFEIRDYSAERFAETTQRWGGGTLQITGGILRKECAALMAGYKKWTKQ